MDRILLDPITVQLRAGGIAAFHIAAGATFRVADHPFGTS